MATAVTAVAAIESLGITAEELIAAGAQPYELPDNSAHVAEIAASHEQIYTSARD